MHFEIMAAVVRISAVGQRIRDLFVLAFQSSAGSPVVAFTLGLHLQAKNILGSRRRFKVE
jgi:hypothetical protein